MFCIKTREVLISAFCLLTSNYTLLPYTILPIGDPCYSPEGGSNSLPLLAAADFGQGH